MHSLECFLGRMNSPRNIRDSVVAELEGHCRLTEVHSHAWPSVSTAPSNVPGQLSLMNSLSKPTPNGRKPCRFFSMHCGYYIS